MRNATAHETQLDLSVLLSDPINEEEKSKYGELFNFTYRETIEDVNIRAQNLSVSLF